MEPNGSCRRRGLRLVSLVACLAPCLVVVGCGGALWGTGPSEGELELATVMGELQRHAAKLGYSLDSRNQLLAAFYLEEVLESVQTLRAVERHDGMPIAEPLELIVDPLIPPLESAVQAGDWDGAWMAYENLIDGCNRCHAATEHEFLVIVPASGRAPYSQVF